MGIGPISPDLAGSVTAPSTFPLVLPTVETVKAWPHGLHSWMTPGGEIRMLMWADGEGRRYHVLTDTPYRTGLLAPFAALTATPTGARATATLTINSDTIGDGYDLIVAAVAHGAATEAVNVVFKTTLSAVAAVDEVKIAGSNANALANLAKLIAGTGGDGSDYRTSGAAGSLYQSGVITGAATAGTSFLFTAVDFGTTGNGYGAQLGATGWTTATLGASNFFSGGTDGSGTEPGAATYGYAYQFRRSADGALSGVSPLVEARQGTAQNIALASIAAPDVDDDIDFKRWLRTPANAGRLFAGYDIVEADVDDTDDLSNTLLEKRLQHNSRIHRGYSGGLVERTRYLCPYKGAWLAAGFKRRASYSVGTASVTNGSRKVTITTGLPTQVMEHWTFQTDASIADDSTEYTVIWVDEANQDLYLDREWEGIGAPTSRAYKLTDTRDPFRIFRCEPTLPNQTDEDMVLDGMLSQDPEGCTGLFPFQGTAIGFTRTGIWRVSGPLSALRIDHEWEGTGCSGGHSVVDPGDGYLYWLAPDGIKRWTGRGEPQDLTNPGFLGRKAKGIARTVARVNQSAAHNTFGHYDPITRIIRWFVPLDNNVTNEHALVFHMDTGAWTIDTGLPAITYARSVSDPSGNIRTLAGNVHGELYELDVSTSDGAYGFEPRAAITSSTVNTITCSAASFPTTGDALAGVPVVAIDADGDFTETYVTSNTGTVLTLAHYLDAALTGTVMVGGIHMRIESGRWDDGDPANKTILESVKMFFTPQTDGQFWVSSSQDQGSPVIRPNVSGDLTLTDGEQHFWFRKRGRQNKIQIDCIEPGCAPSFRTCQIWARVREEAYQ